MSENSQDANTNGRKLIGVQKIRTMIEGFDDISHGGMP
jgi:circadian clock protein KaiC